MLATAHEEGSPALKAAMQPVGPELQRLEQAIARASNILAALETTTLETVAKVR